MPVADIFARSRYEPDQELDAAIKKVGYDIDDVKHVVIGHLHLGKSFVRCSTITMSKLTSAAKHQRSRRWLGPLDWEGRADLGSQDR